MADGYIHGRDPEETKRLEEQAAFVGGVLLDGVEVPRESDKVLDLGCGVGAMTRLLVERGAVHPVGVDVEPRQVRDARRLTPRGAASFLCADAHRLPFADGAFELVYTSWFFEHVPDVPSTLREIARVLEPGGLLWAGEVENSSFLVWPRSEALEKAWAAFNEAQLALGGDPFVGRKLSGLLLDAGFSADVWTHTFHGHTGKPDAFAAMVKEFVEILKSGRDNVVNTRKLLDAKIYDRAIDDLVKLPKTRGGTFTYTFMRARATRERRGRR